MVDVRRGIPGGKCFSGCYFIRKGIETRYPVSQKETARHDDDDQPDTIEMQEAGVIRRKGMEV